MFYKSVSSCNRRFFLYEFLRGMSRRKAINRSHLAFLAVRTQSVPEETDS